MNSLEKYLRDNKEQLDLEQVNDELWLNIENKILKQKHQKRGLYLKWISFAACILALCLLSLLLMNNKKSDPIEILAQYGIDNTRYTKQVNLKKNLLAKASIPLDKQKDFDLLLKQLAFLDGQYDHYLKQVEEHGYEQLIGQQIINYYKTKINLLDKIQVEIEKINYYEKKYNKETETARLSL